MQSEPSPVPARPRQGGRADPPEETPDGGRPWLSVAAAARRLGVAPATLRTWDRRYGIGPSRHEAGRHRRYSGDDVARLELMQQALVRGVSPGEAAGWALATRLPDGSDRPRAVIGEAHPAGPESGAETGKPLLAGTDGMGEVGSRVRVGGHVLRLPGAGRRARGLGRAALALDPAVARALLVDAVAADGVQKAWDEVARPVLVAVAQRWASTGAGVEIEHLLSECVTGVFATIAAAAPLHDGRPVVLAGMPGEHHVLPLVVLSAALAERGVATRSLGSDLPVESLVAALRRTAPAAVVLWSQLPATADPAVVRTLPRTRPRARVFVGGPGWDGVELPVSVGRPASLAAAVETVAAAATP